MEFTDVRRILNVLAACGVGGYIVGMAMGKPEAGALVGLLFGALVVVGVDK